MFKKSKGSSIDAIKADVDMDLVVVVVVVVISLPAEGTLRTVIADNQTDQDVLIMEGDSVRLSCHTDMQWFFCLWNSPKLGTDNKTKKII